MLQAGLQDLTNAEATARIGAAPHERIPERATRRNGTRPKTLATLAGEVELAIPKLREGSFFPPSLLSPRRRVDKALYVVICQAWIDGVPPVKSTSWCAPWATRQALAVRPCRGSAPRSTRPSPTS